MTKITIFTDPHLGVSRQAHTTRESAARLKNELFTEAYAIVETSEHPVVCVGDLYDRAFNSEDVLVQGHCIASKCLITLAGNHDLSNREGTVTSLQAIKKMGAPVCIAPDLTRPYYEVHLGCLYLVPHHASQEVFERAMHEAAAHAAIHRAGKPAYIFLHCNYQFGLATEDSTLNLTAEMTEIVCEAFDYVFLGHEHNPATHKNGKVVILGNHHPSSYADISDKYLYTLDLETAELTKELTWSKAERFLELKLGQEIPNLDSISFIDVVGSEGVSEASVVSDYIQQVWKESYYDVEEEYGGGRESGLFAVRNSVKLKDTLQDVDTAVDVKVEDLRSRIAADLAGSDLEPVYRELLAEVEQ